MPPDYRPPTRAPGGFHRLHPLTPLVTGRASSACSLFVAIANLSSSRRRGTESIGDGGITFAIYAAIAVVVVLGGLVLVARHALPRRAGRAARRLGPARRQSKRLRLDRLQSVDVLRPLVARMFGLAELRLTAGGTEHTSVRLRYLPSDLAQQLRAELLGRAAGLGPGVAEAPERPLVVVSPGALIGSTLLDLASGRGLLLFSIGPVVAAIACSQRIQDGRHQRRAWRRSSRFLFVVGGDVWRRLNTPVAVHRRRVARRAQTALRSAVHEGADRAARKDPGAARPPAASLAARSDGRRFT